MTRITATMLPPCEEDVDLDYDVCPDCEGEGEVLTMSGRYGSRLVPCPAWCASAHRLYDDRGDHDRSEDRPCSKEL